MVLLNVVLQWVEWDPIALKEFQCLLLKSQGTENKKKSLIFWSTFHEIMTDDLPLLHEPFGSGFGLVADSCLLEKKVSQISKYSKKNSSIIHEIAWSFLISTTHFASKAYPPFFSLNIQPDRIFSHYAQKTLLQNCTRSP